MKRIIALWTAALLLLVSLCACGVGQTAETADGKAEKPADAQRNDAQTNASAFDAYTLGTAVDTVPENDAHVYQKVYRYDTATRQFVLQTTYRYEDFISFDTAENADPVRFADGRALYVYAGIGDVVGDRWCAVTRSAVCRFVEEKILPLRFAAGTAPTERMHTVELKLQSDGGQAEVFTVYRDGTVARGEDEVAATRLTDAETAYLFAVKAAYIFVPDKSTDYLTTRYELEGADPRTTVSIVRAAGGETALSAEQANDLLALLSDAPGPGNEIALYGFASTQRVNKAPDTTGGDAALRVIVRKDGSERVFLVYADGTVTLCDGVRVEYDTLDHDQICDSLTNFDRWFVSVTKFDMAAVNAWLAGFDAAD